MSSDQNTLSPSAPAPRVPDLAICLVRRSAHAMLVVDETGVILDANARAEPLLNSATADLLGTRVSRFFVERDHARILKRVELAAHAREAVADLDAHLSRAEDGLVAVSFMPFDAEGGALVLVQVRDLTREQTERHRAQALEADSLRARASQDRKMIDLGGLISGVAHEMRTPVTYVANTLALERRALEDVLRTREDPEPRLRHALELNAMAAQGLDRVHRLLHELRPLTKNKPHRAVRMDLAELVVDAVRTFRGSHAGSTRVELDLESTHAIAVDREDMCNVVVNLLVNAAQAMGDRGVVRVQTRNVTGPPTIRVIDHGPGVAPELKGRLGEPFFTTKPDGTGLGLFISRRTVEAHGGTLTIEDTPGGGATFVVRMPMHA